MRQTLFYDDGTYTELESRSISSTVFRYRTVHDTERVNIDLEQDDYIPNTPKPWGKGVIRKAVRDKGEALPEVYRFNPHHSVLLTSALQWLFYGINSELSKLKWRSLLGSNLAFSNMGAGFDTPHADYINQRDLEYKPPSFDIVRYCGGATLKGYRVGDKVYIEYININKKLPTVAELLASTHLWFYGTSISPIGRIQYMQKMGVDGYLKKIRIPLFASQDIWIYTSELHQLNHDEYIAPNIIVYKG